VFAFTNDSGEYKIGMTFVCEYRGGEVRLSEEHSDYRWINAQEFKQFESTPALYDEIITYANKFSGEYERFAVSQKAVLIRDKKCFIGEVSKRPGIWDLPGGRIGNDEGASNAFKREIEEELGIVEFQILTTLDHDIWRTKNGVPVFGIAFLIESADEIILSQEHARGAWITEEEIDTHKFIWRNMDRMIKKGFEYRRRIND
jgi:8-oxo-dGTP pyrophosphatase MutT (NUDIX family)